MLSKEGGEWWKGELNGQVGLFPSNYVQPLSEQQPSEATRCECVQGKGGWCGLVGSVKGRAGDALQ